MFQLPKLPYDHEALQPVISPETLHYHHGKHHAKYVEVLNQLIEGKDLAGAELEEIVRRSAGQPDSKKLFNNAAQTWNHTFFWMCMSPEKARPEGDLAKAIERDLGGVEGLKKAFVDEGAGHFASGWAWLAAEGEKLVVVSTHDGENLLTRKELTPLLTCDLWEHAYYLDYQNDRKAFLDAWFDAMPDWEFAARQYDAARGQGQAWRHPGPTASGAEQRAGAR